MKLAFARALVIAGVTALSASMLAQGQGPRRDGNWQVTVEMEMSGMPQRMPPMTMTQCVTKEEAADPSKAIPQGPAGRGGVPPDCKVSDYKAEGNKVSWSMKCEGQNPMTGTGEFTYVGETYNGTMKMNMENGRGGGPMTMTMKYSGKRLGDCTK
jgi:hypothetical protein